MGREEGEIKVKKDGRNSSLREPLKNAELAKHFQKYKGRGALREDSVEDEERYRAVFTEQDVSASQMAAVKFLDTRV